MSFKAKIEGSDYLCARCVMCVLCALTAKHSDARRAAATIKTIWIKKKHKTSASRCLYSLNQRFPRFCSRIYNRNLNEIIKWKHDRRISVSKAYHIFSAAAKERKRERNNKFVFVDLVSIKWRTEKKQKLSMAQSPEPGRTANWVKWVMESKTMSFTYRINQNDLGRWQLYFVRIIYRMWMCWARTRNWLHEFPVISPGRRKHNQIALKLNA